MQVQMQVQGAACLATSFSMLHVALGMYGLPQNALHLLHSFS